ncbi:Nitrogen fixation protein FixH [Thiothrix eikelboomii]|uniref:Nitrogen fixation protein FixH n=1 Tax=Thiothrix eikelboomii TaxID=92487 RepID=A0A1T4WNG6_9GAMM|nr:FixH family protein [Thiothrix eikelboomii]SKA78677.1 Nitrogen fixation protein FixH [Thiothrix eikelboomii]
MENYSLLTTLGIGVFASFALFFLFYLGLKWNSKLAALVTILLVMGVYIPLAATHWAGVDVFAIHFAFFVMSGYGLGIITSHRSHRQRLEAKLGQTSTQPKKGWFHWAPAIIVVFFIVLATVDSIIITLANKGASSEFMARFLPAPRFTSSPVTSVFPGAVPHDFKEKYAQFNQHLDQLEVQRERGWQVLNGWQQTPRAGQAAVFSISVTDKAGQPVSGAQVEVRFLRPADKSKDKQFTLPESNLGTYGQSVQLDEPGSWTVVLRIQRGDEVHEVKGTTHVSALAG